MRDDKQPARAGLPQVAEAKTDLQDIWDMGDRLAKVAGQDLELPEGEEFETAGLLIEAHKADIPLDKMLQDRKITRAEAKVLRQRVSEEKRWKRRQRSRFWTHRDVNRGVESFAAGLNIYKVMWVFMLGSFFGVVFETLYVYFTGGVWVRRSGVLYGPFNQVYGFGAVAFTLILYRFRKKNALLIFMASAALGALFEYACSWIEQLVFGSVSWEYSDMPANIGGRTNLYYAAGWGIMGMLFIIHFWPWLSEMIERIPNTLGNRVTAKAITLVLFCALALNMLFTGAAVFRAGQRADGIPANEPIAQFLDTYFPDELMRREFPDMEFVGRGTDAGEVYDDIREDTSPDQSETDSTAAGYSAPRRQIG